MATKAKKEYKFDNMDADEGIFFNRELDRVKARSYDVQYPELKARSLMPVDSESDPGMEFVRYEQFDEVGSAKVIASYAGDLPRADVKGKEFTSPVRGIGSSFGYNLQEVRASARANKRLPERKAAAARRVIEKKIDDILWSGDSTYGLLGLLNQPNANTCTLTADGTGGTTTWSTKTPDQVVRDLHAIANTSVNLTNEIEIPDTLLLPLTSYQYISNTRMGDGSDKTIKQFFLETSEYIKRIETSIKLETAGSGSTKRAVAYKNSNEKFEAVIPQEFETLDPERRGLEWVTMCHARCGGVLAYYPMSITYADGF
jgi:hypothetical protein